LSDPNDPESPFDTCRFKAVPFAPLVHHSCWMPPFNSTSRTFQPPLRATWRTTCTWTIFCLVLIPN
jgi:hypothetical protein